MRGATQVGTYSRSGESRKMKVGENCSDIIIGFAAVLAVAAGAMSNVVIFS